MTDKPTPLASKNRTLWLAWSDQNDGWAAAIHGVAEFREHIEKRIARDAEEYGRNRFGLRPVRVTVHLSDEPTSAVETTAGVPVHYGSDGKLHLGEGPDGRRPPENG